jgi:hypothetical protein
VPLTALAATLTSQQVTRYRVNAIDLPAAGTIDGQPDTADHLGPCRRTTCRVGLAGLGRREDALAAIEEAVTIRPELQLPGGPVPTTTSWISRCELLPGFSAVKATHPTRA